MEVNGRAWRSIAMPRLWMLALLAFAAATATAADNPGQPLRVAGGASLADLPTMVAASEGRFLRHGLEVVVQRHGSGAQNLQALRAGEIDVALMTATPLTLELLQRPPEGEASDPQVIASLVYASRLDHVVARAGSGIRTSSDLLDRRIGLVAGTNAEFLWWSFTALHGLDPDAATIVDLPIESLPEALIAGNIDAAVLWEPWTSRLKARLPADRLFFLPGSNIYAGRWVLVTTRGMLKDHPGTMQRLLSAYRDAISSIDNDPERALDLYLEDAGLDPESALHDPGLPPFGLALDWSLLTSLQQLIAWARATDKPIAETPTDILSWLDAAPLRAIKPEGVSIPVRAPHTEPHSPLSCCDCHASALQAACWALHC